MWIWGKWVQNEFWGITWQLPVRYSRKNPSFNSEFHKKRLDFFNWKFRPSRALGASIEIWGKRAQNYFLGITWQPRARFLRITPHFVQNFMTNTLLGFFWKFSLKWWLGPSMWIWGKWAQNGFWGITWQPPVRFSQKTPHFIQI